MGGSTTTGLRAARRSLVEGHIELVDGLARRLRGQLDSSLPLDDLKSFGFEALVKASRHFNPRLGVPFGAYARHRVRGAMLDGLAELGGIPRRMYRRFRFDRATSELAGAWPAAPLETQQARGDALTFREVLRVAFLLVCDGVDDWSHGGNEQEDEMARRQLQQRVAQAIHSLPERQQALLVSHYYKGESLAAAGRSVGISRSYALRMHRSALLQLREKLGFDTLQ